MTGFAQHEAARAWLDERLDGTTRVALPWESLIAFVRLVTNPRIFPRPESVGGAWSQVEAWLEVPVASIPVPTEQHRATLAGLLEATGLGAAGVHDAHLAALAIEHGLTLCSADSDFARFPGLRWSNPLAA